VSRLPRRVWAASVAAAAVVGAAVGVALHGQLAAPQAAAKTPALRGEATWAAGQAAAPGFVLRDQHGRAVSLRSLRGRSVVLMFEDSLCKQACPIEGKLVAASIRRVAPALRPRVVVVSVDPAGDTPHTVAVALRKWHLPGSASWLVGSRAELRPVWRAYRITVEAVAGDIVHSTALYVIDRNGDERAGLLLPFAAGDLAADLRAIST
jgi:protein SCO1/2